MIKTSMGNTKIEGSLPVIMADFSVITKSMFEMLTDTADYTEDTAKAELEQAFYRAFEVDEADDVPEKNPLEEIIKEFLIRALKESEDR